MPIRLNVGVSKKLGLPRYSSVGVSCALEVELSSTLLDQGGDAFHERLRGDGRDQPEAGRSNARAPMPPPW